MRLRTALPAGLAAGLVAGLLTRAVAAEFAVLFWVAGVLMLYVGTIGLTDDRRWTEFVGGRPVGRSPTTRIVLCGLAFTAGAAWCFGGLVGVLVLLGVE